MGFDGLPFIVGWELTLACNLRCHHCGSSAGLPRDKELTLKEALSICDQFPSLLVQEVNFTGGEPLLRPDWHRIASHLGKLNISTKILTNGLTVDQDLLLQMNDAGLDGIGFSLDGLETTHDHIRGANGVFNRLVSSIKMTVSMGPTVTVITTVNALNIDELPLMLSLLAALGVTRWQIQPVFLLGRCSEVAELQLTDEVYMRLGHFVQEWTPKAKELDVALLPGDSFGYCTDLDTREPPWKGCPAGLVSCGITSDGRVKGCLSLPDEISEGNLREKDLWDIWFDPKSFSYTRHFSRENLGANCRLCDKADQCRGGCSAMSYGTTGAFNNDPFCFYGIQNKHNWK